MIYPFRLFYQAFRFGPFLVVLYFMLSSLLTQDYNNLIYLMGVIMACFFAVVTGALWTSKVNETPETVCHPIRLGTGERLSGLPLSIVVYVYTLCYFAIPIIKTKTQAANVLFLTGFPVLILFDLIWLRMFGCSSIFRMVVAGVVGITVGLSWGEIVYELELSVLPSQGRANSCMIPTPPGSPDPSSGEPLNIPQNYICVKRHREGFDSMTPTPTTNPMDLSKISKIVTVLIKVFTTGQKYLEPNKDKQYYSTIYDNYTFHLNNMSILNSSLLKESQNIITDSDRKSYYNTFFSTIQKNINDSLNNIQTAQAFINPDDYSKIYNNFKDSLYQASLLLK